MFNVKLIAVGKLKESYLTEAVSEYAKRLKAYCKFEIIELKEAFLPENPSEKEIEAALSQEAKDILKAAADSVTVALCIEGKQTSSEGLAKEIEKFGNTGNGSISFIIGSSHGLSNEVKNRAARRLSMSEMTFPHQLARVMVAEQIYRAFSIMNNGKYHK